MDVRYGYIITTVILLAVTTNCPRCYAVYPQYSIVYNLPADCVYVLSNYAYFFNSTSQSCSPCAQNITYQVTSLNERSCVCQSGYQLTYNYGNYILCSPCPPGQTTSDDGWDCISCNSSGQVTGSSPCPSCATGKITVQRLLDGTLITAPNSSQPIQVCEQCANYTSSNADGTQCLRCNQVLSMVNSTDCSCPYVVSGICFANPVETVLNTVSFGSATVTSAYFQQYAAGAFGMCSAPYFNVTACEQLGNLCVLTIYDTKISNSVCSLYESMVGSTVWQPWLPWLYYSSNGAAAALSDTGIPTQFSFPNYQIPFRVDATAVNGTFLGYFSVTNGLLQFCKNTQGYLNAAYVFGVTYSQSCSLSVSTFWDEAANPLVFYDMWLEYTQNSSGTSMLYAVPVLILNYNNSAGTSVNAGSDQSTWQLVRRFFLVDNLSGKTALGINNPAQYVRYAQSMTLNIELQPDNGQGGLIYPPYLSIDYNYVSLAEYNTSTTLTFQVVYSMSYSQFQTDVSIAVAVLSGIAVGYALLRTWSWNRRTGRLAIDFLAIIKFVVFSCGYVANAIFVVILGASIWWEFFYKNQGTVLVVAQTTNSYYVMFLAISFSLKAVELIHLLVVQTNVNIFLVDWERPENRPNDKVTNANDSNVSVWRTYFVANEWNELQAQRKISSVFQIIASVFCLSVIGFGNLATTDPYSNYQLDNPNQYYAPMSDMLRFSLIGMVYLLIALAQWLFFTLIYERFFEHPVQDFVDLCSVCNISVLLLEDKLFGYYIHGRSVHGRADVGMRQTHINMAREQSDLCGNRGMESGSDIQTYAISVPKNLRIRYERVLMPVLLMQQGAASVAAAQRTHHDGTSIKLDPQLESCIEAYSSLNNLFQDFIDHSLKNIDYEVRDRKLLEQILNVEFQNSTDKSGYFYNDKRFSFDTLLFYGNELMILIFEVLFFAIIDLGTQNYVFDGAMLYLAMEVFFKGIRRAAGRLNLAKKTLVDKRFLV